MNVTVSDSDLKEVKSCLGYPLIDEFDWGTDTDSFITDFILPKVIRMYFTYFPIVKESNHVVNQAFEIDYPYADVFRVFQHFFNYNTVNYGSMSPFILQAQVLQQRPFSENQSYLSSAEVMTRWSTYESMIDYIKAVRVTDYPNERKVRGSSNIAGELLIKWASSTEDFSDIQYNKKDDAIKLAQGYLLKEAARLRSQAVITSSKVSINTDVLLRDGEAYIQEVTQSWKSRGFAVVGKL
jgi:hypothetical protein